MQKMHKMKPKTPIPIVKVDHTKKAWEQTTTALHNRWHPDLPVVRTLVSRNYKLLLPATWSFKNLFACCSDGSELP